MGGSSLAGMVLSEFLSMVIRDFDIEGVTALPSKTHAELVVDANAVLPDAIALEGFETVAGRDTQITQRGGCLEILELAAGDGLDVHETPHTQAVEQGFGVFVGKRLYHSLSYTDTRYGTTPRATAEQWDNGATTRCANLFRVYQRGT